MERGIGIDMVELRQDLEEAALSLYAVGDAVQRLPYADETLSKGLCLAIQSLAENVERILPTDAGNHVCLSPEQHLRLSVLVELLQADISDGAVSLETASDVVKAIKEVLAGAVS